MAKYEMMYIAKAMDEKAIETTIDAMNKRIAEFDEWGKKRLAYEIDNESFGYYVLATFDFSGKRDALKKLSKIVEGDENILRHMIIAYERTEA